MSIPCTASEECLSTQPLFTFLLLKWEQKLPAFKLLHSVLWLCHNMFAGLDTITLCSSLRELWLSGRGGCITSKCCMRHAWLASFPWTPSCKQLIINLASLGSARSVRGKALSRYVYLLLYQTILRWCARTLFLSSWYWQHNVTFIKLNWL